MSPTSYQLLHSAIFDCFLLYLYYTLNKAIMQHFFSLFKVFIFPVIFTQEYPPRPCAADRFTNLSTESGNVELYSGTHCCCDNAGLDILTLCSGRLGFYNGGHKCVKVLL